MRAWFTADWHLGQKNPEIMHRPFEGPDEMADFMSNRHNTFVNEDDTVYVVGDVCHSTSPEALPQVAKFNGRKVLIRGNHDRVFSDDELRPYFDVIVAEGEGVEMGINGLPCYVTHYPTCGVANRFNIVGHVHSVWRLQLNMINIGVDANHFTPTSADNIPKELDSIRTFYDDDAWVAYNETNSMFYGKRGLQETRFPE
jgi:calcineurin-like phosphoesterase family protein